MIELDEAGIPMLAQASDTRQFTKSGWDLTAGAQRAAPPAECQHVMANDEECFGAPGTPYCRDCNATFSYGQWHLAKAEHRVTENAMTKCDCINDCGDDPAIKRGEVQPCESFAKFEAARRDNTAVDRFAGAMRLKMAASRDKGRGGWHDPEQCPPERLAAMLVEHIAKGDPVDVGNFAMMLFNRPDALGVLSRAAPPAPVSGADGRIAEGPEGFVLVPIRPTLEMRAAMLETIQMMDEGPEPGDDEITTVDVWANTLINRPNPFPRKSDSVVHFVQSAPLTNEGGSALGPDEDGLPIARFSYRGSNGMVPHANGTWVRYGEVERRIREGGKAEGVDYEAVLSDHRRMVRELDVLLNGEAGAAKQASLCDIVSQVRRTGTRIAAHAPSASPATLTLADAVAHIERKAEEYASQFGYGDAGTLCFDSQVKMDHYTSLTELDDELRELAAPQPQGSARR